MKILTAMYTMRRGGSYERFQLMIEAFLERGCEIHCLSLSPVPISHRLYHNHILKLPFQGRYFPITKCIMFLLLPLYAFWIGWRRKINLHLAFGTRYAFIQGFSKWVLKKSMVTFVRGDAYFEKKMQGVPKCILKLNRIIEYLGVNFSDRIITVNKGLQEEMRKISKERTEVQVLFNNILPVKIPSFHEVLKIRERLKIPHENKVLMTAGVLKRGKNIELLIKSLARIETGPMVLVIIGEGAPNEDSQYKEDLLRLGEQLGLNGRVILIRWLEKEYLWRLFKASDLFLLPSLREGSPNTLLEAIGLDLVCLGSRIPGIQDILFYEELMFNPLDENLLANRIQEIFSNPQEFDNLRRLCAERKNVFMFDWKEKIFNMVTKRGSFE